MEIDRQELSLLEEKVKSGMTYEQAYSESIKKASAAAKEHAVSTKGVSGATDTFVAKQKKAQAELEATATSSKVAAVGVKALKLAFNMFSGLVISFAISKIIEGIQYLGESAERAKEKLEDIRTDLNDNQSSYESNRKTLEGLKDEYNSLTDKADKLGGVQNLTNEEYKRYTEIMSQILGITPKLITGWDNEGNAISNKNGLLQQSIDLLDEEYEKSVRNNTTKKKNEEVAKGVIAELNEFENSADTKTIGGTISPLMLDFTDALKKVDNKNDKLNDYDIVKQLYTYLYPNAKDLSELEKGTGNWIDRLKNIIYDKKDFEKLSKSFTDKNNPIYDLFSDDKDINHMIENANDYFKELNSIQDDRETYYQKFKDQLNWNSQAATDDSGKNAYKQLSDKSKSSITEYINNLDYASIKTEDDFLSMADNVKSFTKTLASDDTFADYIDDIFTPQGKDEGIEKYTKRVNDAITNAQKYIKDHNLSFSLDFGTEDNPKGIKESVDKLHDKYEDTINRFKSDASDSSSKELDSLNNDEQTQNLANARKNLTNEYDKISNWGLDYYADQIKNNTIQTKFGNVDMDKRTIIHWSDELKQTYADALASWDYDPEVGSIDTVFGGSERFGEGFKGHEEGWEVAFTPILPDGTFLSKDTVEEYINAILQKAYADDGKVTDDELKKIDKQGLQIGNTFVKSIYAGIDDSQNYDNNGNRAELVGRLMHFSGKFGAVQIAKDEIEELEKQFGKDGSQTIADFFNTEGINTQDEIDAFNDVTKNINDADKAIKAYKKDKQDTKKVNKSFSKAWSELDNVDSNSDMKNTKEELLKLAEAGKLTKKTFKSVKGSDSFLDLMGLKEKDIEKVNKQINKIVDSVKQLSSLKTGISAITSAYDEKKESKKNTVSSSTLNSLGDTLGVSEWNEKDKKVWENYKDTAGNSKKSLSQLKDAQDELASSYANSNNFLANLNSQNKNYYISLLKEMGVVNAEEIVTKKLRKEQKDLAIVKKELGYESEDLNDSTVSEISRMYDSETASKAAKNAMFDLTLEKIRNGQVKISTAADCTALLNMAQAAGIALSKLKELTNASIEMNLAERQTKDADSLQDALNSGRKTYVSSSGSVLKASESKLAHLRNMSNSNRLKAQKNIDKYAKKHKDDYKLNIELTKGNKSNGSKGKTKGSKSKSKSSNSTVIDWIERKLDRLNTKLDLVKAKYDNLPSSSKSSAALLKAENKNLDDQIKILKKVQSVNNKSYSKYMKKANNSATYKTGKGKKKKTYKLSKSLKKKIQNGRIKGSYKKLIATYGEPKANAIQKYQDYYDKAQSSRKNSQDAKKSITDAKVEKLTNAQNYYDTLNAMNQAYESTAKGLSKNNYVQEQIEATKQSYNYQIKIAKAQGDYNKKKQLEQEKEKAILDLQRQKVENIKTFYDNQVGLLDNDKQDIQNKIDLIEARGDIVSKGYYKNLTSEDNAIISKREAELKDLKSQLSTTDQGTDNWYELQNDIQSVENEINDHKKSVYENTKAIGELNDKMYEAIYAVSSNLNAELDTISSLKRGEVSDSDTGTLTDTGFLQLYAAGLSYSATKGTAAEANARLAEIIKANKNGKVLEGYTSLQAQKDAEAQLAKDAQDQVTSVKSYGDKIIEIIKDAISSVADHLQEIIDARKEALNEEKDLRDYERSILEKTKNVSSLQKQFMAVSGDTSEEGRLKAAQLRKSLDEAQQDLQDTEYDRYISDQQEMLDNMMNQFQDLMEKLQKDEDTLLREGIKAINDQKGVMQQIFNKTAEEYGYPTSTNLTELQTALTTGRITADIINSAKDDSVTSVIKKEAEKIVKAYGDAKSGTGGGTPSTGGDKPNGGTKNNNSSKGQQTQTNNGQTTIKPDVTKNLDEKNTTEAEKKAIDKGNKIRAALNKIKGSGYEDFWTDKNGTPKSITNQRISAEPNYDRVYKNAKGKTVRVPQILTKEGLKWLASKLGIKRSELNSYVKSSAFATGGIAKIKPVGEDGIAWVRNGEGFVRPEDVQHIRDLMAVTPDLTKLVSSFSNLPNVKPLDKNVTKNVSIDHITFDMPNVTNATDFTDTIKKPEQQKAFAAAIGDAFNGKKLNINRY